MNEESLPKPTCAKCHTELGNPKPRAAKGRRQFCTDKCQKTAWWRAKNGKPIADPIHELDRLVAEKNRLAAELLAIQPRLEATTEKLQDAANTKRRLSYAADTADASADKKIVDHASAIEVSRDRAVQWASTADELRDQRDDYKRLASGSQSEIERLRDQNAVLRDRLRLEKERASRQQDRAQTVPEAKPEIIPTFATQIYRSFDVLVRDFRDLLSGSQMDEQQWRIIEHGRRNQERLKLNTNELDLRTVYMFANLTRAAYKRAKRLGHNDVQINKAVSLFNAYTRLHEIPKRMPQNGPAVTLPTVAPAKNESQP